MPKILRIINRFNLGGPTYNVSYLTRYLAPEFETMLVGGMKDETEDTSEFIAQNLDLKPVIIPEMRRAIDPKMDVAAYRKLRELIREFKPDIVHTHASKAGTLGRLAARKEKVPVIVHTFHGHVFHSYFGKAKTLFYKAIERRLARSSTRIIAISEKQKHELAVEHRIAPANKIEVIPLGFDLSRFRENMDAKRAQFRADWNVAENEIAIGIIGRLVPIKNHRLFLEAIKQLLAQTNQPVRAFIIGDGETRDAVEADAKELGLPYSTSPTEKVPVTFTSWIRNVDVAYAGMDIVALTSLNEGTPVSLIEAQASNRPVVSTNVGGIENVVVPGTTAFLNDKHDAQGIAASLLKLVENADLRQTMGEAGWSQVGKKYHYERLVADTRNLYNQLLANT